MVIESGEIQSTKEEVKCDQTANSGKLQLHLIQFLEISQYESLF